MTTTSTLDMRALDMETIPEAARPYYAAALLWQCHQEGYRGASEQGLSFSDNPYEQGDMHTAWSNGWHAACYHRAQHREQLAQAVARRWHTMEEGKRAYSRGKNANEAPYDDAQLREAGEWGWMVGRYETVERLQQQTQKRLAEADTFAEQMNAAVEVERVEKVVLSAQLLELAAELRHVRRAYQEGMAGAMVGMEVSSYHQDTEALQHWAWMQGNAHQTATHERDHLRDERNTLAAQLQALADGYSAASNGQPFKANPIPTTNVALYTLWQRGWRLRYCEVRLDAMRGALCSVPRISTLLKSLPEEQQARNAALLEVGEIEQACERAHRGTESVPPTILPVTRDLVGV